MKVTAFIRKTASKNNVTDLARVYFRLRDKGGVDIKGGKRALHQSQPLECGEAGLQIPRSTRLGREAHEV